MCKMKNQKADKEPVGALSIEGRQKKREWNVWTFRANGGGWWLVASGFDLQILRLMRYLMKNRVQ